ncbi:MAG: IPT/TIG domain-containing protein [Ignavibacteriae bacterium]|nr:IPT/TIG domain-containing protein [Ignavibacteriota bacterium]
MKTFLQFRTLAGWLLAGALLIGCKEEPPASLYNQNVGQGPTPVITTVAPADSALAGVTEITITGQNFSPVKQNNFVYFNSALGTILQASATSLVVKAPLLIADSVGLKIATQGVELFSNAIRYKLNAAVIEFGTLASTVEDPQGMTCDSSGNLYVSLLTSLGSGLGVKKVTPAGVRTDYAPPFSSAVNKWTSMKVGPGGYIYATSNRNAVFRISNVGGSSAPWANTGSVGVAVTSDLDFDNLGNIWACGDTNKIVRITPGAPGSPAASQRAFPFAGDVRAVRFFQNHLYLAAKNDTIWNIWKMRVISGDSVGARELYFNFTQRFGATATPYCITFSNSGELLVGTDSSAGSLVIVHQNGTGEKFYPGVVTGKIVSLAYGKGTEMYISRTGFATAMMKTMRVNTQMQGAPYYGRQ